MMRHACAALLLAASLTMSSALRMSVSESRGTFPMRASSRSDIASFKVMDVVQAAVAMESTGRKVYHMEVGQPSTGATQAVKKAASEIVLSDEKLGYTESMGVMPLREAICEHYRKKEGVELDPRRVIITTGSSGGFLLAFNACFDAGDCVAVGTTCYPCYRNILKAMDCDPVPIELNSEYKLTAAELKKEVDRREKAGLPRLKGVIQSSPSNPTGSMLTSAEVEEVCKFCHDNDIWFLSDEIYHGISFGFEDASALRFPKYESRTLVLNSFSKTWSMTGWRLGWMVLPETLIEPVYKLQQNMFINAPTLSQLAAVEAFSEESQKELDGHQRRYAANREIILGVMDKLDIKTAPCNGAFYVYADLGDNAKTGASDFCARFLEEEAVAITPGTDFEHPENGFGERRIRFSFPGATEDVEEAMRRFEAFWQRWTAS